MTPTPEQIAHLKELLVFRSEASNLHTINAACEQLGEQINAHLHALIHNTEKLAAVRELCDVNGANAFLARRILSIIDAGNV